MAIIKTPPFRERVRETIQKTCVVCGGAGYIVTTGTETGHGCDGSQESCDATCPVPIPVPVQEQCQWCDETSKTVAEILSLVRGIVPEKKHEGKHDGHENDARSWCYSCNESAQEEEFTDHYAWNACRQAILSEIGEGDE